MIRFPARDEGGAISVFMVGMIVGMFLIAGLVIDGGNAITARGKIYDDAEGAARAGANQVNVDVLRSGGQVVVIEDAARQAALAYLARARPDGTTAEVSVNADSVTVDARTTVNATLLQLIGVRSFEVRGQATADAAAGITGVF